MKSTLTIDFFICGSCLYIGPLIVSGSMNRYTQHLTIGFTTQEPPRIDSQPLIARALAMNLRSTIHYFLLFLLAQAYITFPTASLFGLSSNSKYLSVYKHSRFDGPTSNITTRFPIYPPPIYCSLSDCHKVPAMTPAEWLTRGSECYNNVTSLELDNCTMALCAQLMWHLPKDIKIIETHIAHLNDVPELEADLVPELSILNWSFASHTYLSPGLLKAIKTDADNEIFWAKFPKPCSPCIAQHVTQLTLIVIALLYMTWRL